MNDQRKKKNEMNDQRKKKNEMNENNGEIDFSSKIFEFFILQISKLTKKLSLDFFTLP